MSAAVFSIVSSTVCLARPTRRLTASGTASRKASSSAARVRSPGAASSVVSSSPSASSRRHNRTIGVSGASAAAARPTSWCTCAAVVPGGSSTCASRTTPAVSAIVTRVRRSAPSWRSRSRHRRSMYSTATMSSPLRVLARLVSIDASRNLVATLTARASSSSATRMRLISGRCGRMSSVTDVTIPRVPSDPTNRSIRSISGAA